MLDGISVGNLTAPTLLGICVLLMFLGRLVPWNVLKEKREEAEKWRQAYLVERDARLASDAQKEELLELAKTTHSIVVAAFGADHHARQGGNNVVPTPSQK